MERAGERASGAFADSWEKAAPKVEKAMDKVADAASRLRVEEEKLAELQKRKNASNAQLIAQQERVAAAERRVGAAARDTARIYQQVMEQQQRLAVSAGRRAARGFATSFGSELAAAIPGMSGFTAVWRQQETLAARMGAVVGRAFGMAVTGTAAALIGAAGYSLFKGFERYRSLDATAHRLGAIGKSGEQVRSIMADINSVVEGTPIALDAAAQAATQFLIGGVREGRPLKATLTAIADAAGASGARFEDIALVFQQVFTKGKLQAEEMMQLNERGLNVQEALRREFGLTAADLEKMSKDGQISFGMLVQAIEGSYAGMAQKLGDTIDGALSNARTAVAKIGANMLAAVFGDPMSTTEGPGAMAEAIKSITKRLNDVNAWIVAHRDDIKGAFESAGKAAKDLATLIGGVLDALDRVGLGVGDVVTAFLAWKTISGVIKLSEKLLSIGDILSKTLPAQAEKGARGIGTALSKVQVPVWLAYLISSEIDENLRETKFDRAPHLYGDQSGRMTPWQWWNRAEQGTGELQRRQEWVRTHMPDWTSQDILDREFTPPWGAPGRPATFEEYIEKMPELRPGYNGPHRGPRQPGEAGGPLADLFPAAPGAESGGSSGASRPRLPYPAEYGQPPRPGESIEQWQRRMEGLRLQHTVDELSAYIAELERGGADQAELVEARNQLIDAQMRLQQFQRDSATQVQVPLPAGYGQVLPGETPEQWRHRMALLDAQYEAAKKNAELDALLKSGVASQEEIAKARKEAIDAEIRVWDLQRQALQEVTTGLDQIGAELDADFGISKGLAGIAENITKFLANLGAAPVLGALGVLSNMGGGKNAGSGLIGIAAALSGYGVPRGGGGVVMGGDGASMPSLGQLGYPTASNPLVAVMESLAMRASGGRYSWGASDLVNGLADCSGAISDLVEVLTTGETGPGRLFNTESFPAYAAAHGWRRGFMPGALNVGVRHGGPGGGHMAATLPSGVNFEAGGRTGGIAYGGPAAGALDPQFTEQWYYPVGGVAPTAPTPAAGGGASAPWVTGWWPSSMAPPSSPVPMGPTAAPGAPAAQGGAPAPGGAPAGGGVPAVPPIPGVSPIPGSAGIGTGAGVPGVAAPPAAPAFRVGGVTPYEGVGPGFTGIGGILTAAIQAGVGAGASAGGLAIDSQAPGAGQAAAVAISAAANLGIQEINRAIGFLGQAAAIGAQGVIETFVPNAGSELANRNWITRILGGIAGMAPALPNLAGQITAGQQKQAQPPLQPNEVDPNTTKHGEGNGQAPGPINVEYHNHQATEDRAGADLTWHLQQAYAAPGM